MLFAVLTVGPLSYRIYDPTLLSDTIQASGALLTALNAALAATPSGGVLRVTKDGSSLGWNFQQAVGLFASPRAQPLPAAPSTPWNPVALYGTDLGFYFTPASVTLDGSGNVLTVIDQGPKGRNLTLNGSGNITIVASDQDFNGAPSFSFPGGPYLDSGSWAQAQPFTIVIVLNANPYAHATWDAGPFAFDSVGGTELALIAAGDYYVSAGTQTDTTYGNTLAAGGSTLGQERIGQETHIVEIEFNGASSKVWIDGTLLVTGNFGSNTQASFRLGARKNGASPWTGNVAAVMGLGRVRSAAERTRDYAAMAAKYLPGIIPCHGDSLTLGRDATPLPGGDYPSVMQSNGILGLPARVLNIGTGSQTLATMVSNAASQVDTLYSAARPFNIAVIFGGANDITGLITGGDTPAQAAAAVYASLVTYANARAAVGWKLVACTLSNIAEAPTGTQAAIVLANALIRANASGAPYVLADIGADPRLQDITNLLYFNADQTHLTDVGYAVIAVAVGQVVETLIP